MTDTQRRELCPPRGRAACRRARRDGSSPPALASQQQPSLVDRSMRKHRATSRHFSAGQASLPNFGDASCVGPHVRCARRGHRAELSSEEAIRWPPTVRWYQPHDGPAGPPAPPDRGAPPGRRSQGPAVAQALKRWPTTPTMARRWRRRRRSPTQSSRATATGSQATTDSLNEAPRSTRGHLACEESRRDRLSALQNRGHMRRTTRPSAARPAPVGRARRPRPDGRGPPEQPASADQHRARPPGVPGRIASRSRFARDNERLHSSARDARLGRAASVRRRAIGARRAPASVTRQ